MSVEATDNRLLKLSSLIQFEQELRDAETPRDLAYVVVNDLRRVVDFREAFFWHEDELRRPRIQSVSNVSEVDANVPAIRGLMALSEWLRHEAAFSEIKPFSVSDLPEQSDARRACETLAPYLISVPLRSASGASAGGIVLSSDSPWTESQVALLQVIGDAVSHAWNFFEKQRTLGTTVKRHLARTWRRYLVGLIVLFLLPVRQYVLAPAEVVPESPRIIAAPLEGVIDTVHVEPNENVEKGQLLFEMEDTDLRNEYLLAQRSLEVAEAEYLRNAQKAFQCQKCRGDVPELQALMEREKATVEWAREQLEMSSVEAPTDGIAVFADASEWEGQPVSTGQKVMVLSHPDQVRLRIELPVGDAITLEKGAEVVFYPNVDPLNRHFATLMSSSYEAAQTPGQSLAFTLFADFQDEQARPRLGLHGTAKLYGSRAPLIYLVLRKPVSWLRRTLGF